VLGRSDSILTDDHPAPSELSADPAASVVPPAENHVFVRCTAEEPASVSASASAGLAGNAAAPGRRILLCCDGKGEAEVAWRWTERAVMPADVIFVLAVLPVTAVDAAFQTRLQALGITLEQNLAMLRALRKETVRELELKARTLQQKCASVSVHVLHGDARYSIPRVADFHRCDTVVLGRRDVSGWQRFTASGSVSTHVMATAHQTVVVAREWAEEGAGLDRARPVKK
jgi:nucleotide-binding universal stress UspA family protein